MLINNVNNFIFLNNHSAQFWLGVHCCLYHYHSTSCAPECTTAGLLCTDLNFDAQIWDPCIILTHTYLQSNQDSQRSFSASTKTSSARFGTQNCACLTTFLSTMLIGLNVISSSCVSKLSGQKFTSFLCCHFLSMPLFSLQLKTSRQAFMCKEVLGCKV